MSRLTFSSEQELKKCKWWQFLKKYILKKRIEKIHKIHGTNK
jgi:hypothetical protein